jgi:AraC family transcriptional activator of pobA
MREARRNLAYTNLSIASIAYTLGFTDPAYFSRVFTRDAGISPKAFRAQI